jgi:hypothetical protein
VFVVLVVAPIFIVPVVAPVFVVLKAPYLCLGLVALCRVSKGTKSIGGILDVTYSPSNKLLT